MLKGAVAGISILVALAWSMSKRYTSPLDYPATYLTNALLPVAFCILSAYFVAEILVQVWQPRPHLYPIRNLGDLCQLLVLYAPACAWQLMSQSSAQP